MATRLTGGIRIAQRGERDRDALARRSAARPPPRGRAARARAVKRSRTAALASAAHEQAGDQARPPDARGGRRASRRTAAPPRPIAIPCSAASPAGVSSATRSDERQRPSRSPRRAGTRAPRGTRTAVPSKSTPTSALANAPATSVGQEGPDARRPTPGPCPGGCRGGASWTAAGLGTREAPMTVDDRTAHGPPTREPVPRHPAALPAISSATPALFASRTQGHEVLGDARPHGDHRAPGGHLARRRAARHLDVPARVARRADWRRWRPTGAARALQYAPTEGMAAAKACIAEVMAAEDTPVDPEDILVTTGGQQVIDLVCKTLVDPGDVVVAEAPTYPGAVPTFMRLPGRRRADRDGRRRHARRRARGDARPPRRARAGGRSSSTRSRTSRTRPA